MHDLDPNLADRLASADEETLREIIREAEDFLQAQLQSALASDQRAVTFAGILAAAVAIIVGAIAALENAILAIAFSPMIACFVAAISYAAKAAAPCRFEFSGNDPAEWLVDIEARKPLARSFAEQAAFYSTDIKNNSDVMEKNAGLLTSSGVWAFVGVLFGVAAAIFSLLTAFWPAAN